MPLKELTYILSLTLLLSCQRNFENKPLKPESKLNSIIDNGVKYDGPEKYSFYLSAIKHGGVNIDVDPSFGRYKSGYKEVELRKLKSRALNRFSSINTNSQNSFSNTYAKENAIFIERGPFNVPGRTRPILVDVSRD